MNQGIKKMIHLPGYGRSRRANSELISLRTAGDGYAAEFARIAIGFVAINRTQRIHPGVEEVR